MLGNGTSQELMDVVYKLRRQNQMPNGVLLWLAFGLFLIAWIGTKKEG